MPDITPQAQSTIRGLLETARREIAATIASTEWEASRQGKLVSEIDFFLKKFGEDAKVEIKKTLDLQFAEGQRAADASIAAQIDVGLFPAISESALVSMQRDLGTKITGLVGDATKAVQKELSLGLFGNKTPFETMGKIGRSLDSPSIFGTIEKRSETIVREEFGRTFRKAAQLRMEQVERLVMNLMKQWLHSGHPAVPRQSHLALHGTVINVNEKYQVLNEKTGVIEEAMHPKDPVLSAENSIGCECQSVPWKANWNLKTPDLGALI